MRTTATALVLTLIVLAGCSTPAPTMTPVPTATPTAEPCAGAAAWLDAFDALMVRWDDGLDVATSTARINIAGPIETLQAVKRDVLALDDICPEAVDVKDATVGYMEKTISAFLLFASGESDGIVSGRMSDASQMLPAIAEKVTALQAFAR